MNCKCKSCVYWSRVKIGCINNKRSKDWKSQLFKQVMEKTYTCPSWYPEDSNWEAKYE